MRQRLETADQKPKLGSLREVRRETLQATLALDNGKTETFAVASAEQLERLIAPDESFYVRYARDGRLVELIH